MYWAGLNLTPQSSRNQVLDLFQAPLGFADSFTQRGQRGGGTGSLFQAELGLISVFGHGVSRG